MTSQLNGPKKIILISLINGLLLALRGDGCEGGPLLLSSLEEAVHFDLLVDLE